MLVEDHSIFASLVTDFDLLQWNLEPQHGKEYKLSVNYKGISLYISSNSPSAVSTFNLYHP